MKKTLFPIILSILLAPFSVFAESTPTPAKTPDKVVISTDKPAKEDEPISIDTKNQPLSVRKQSVEVGFRQLITQLSLFSTRTASAVDHLNDKKIDTGKTQDELDLVDIALSDAKLSLAQFSKIEVDDSKPEKTSADLKLLAKRTEISLRDARTHLINALTVLKAALASSLQEGTVQN